MKLITKQIEKDLLKHPLYSQEGKGFDAEVVVKFFGGCGFTWLVTEAEQVGEDWRMYGYVTLNAQDWEWVFYVFRNKKSEIPTFRAPIRERFIQSRNDGKRSALSLYNTPSRGVDTKA